MKHFATPIEARDVFLEALRSRNHSELEAVLHESFTFTDPRGQILIGRNDLIELLRDGSLHFESIELVGESVSESGSDARVEQDVRLAATLRGRKYDGVFRVTELYRRAEGSGWRAVISGVRQKAGA